MNMKRLLTYWFGGDHARENERERERVEVGEETRL